VRQRFAIAAENARFVDHLWKLDAVKLLGPLMTEKSGVSESIEHLSETINHLRSEKFDRIINLSFSPSSSFITHLIAQEKIPVSGYTRTQDLFLRIQDPASQYFRSQVGVDRSNRIHVSDLFAWIAGVELTKSDWHSSLSATDSFKREGIVCHLGASQSQKTWPADSWSALIRRLTQGLNKQVTLVGTASEKEFADEVVLQTGLHNLINLVGMTNFSELTRTIQSAELFVGADSGPLHIASQANTKSVNLSVGNVRFWETGPVVTGSRVLVSKQPQFLMSDFVFENIEGILTHQTPLDGVIECIESQGVRYKIHGKNQTPDYWEVVEYIYFGGPQPKWSADLQEALMQINEVCKMALTQLAALYAAPAKVEIIGVMDRMDELLILMKKTIPPLAPLLDAFSSEKENIPPGSREEIFYQTKQCYERLRLRSVTFKNDNQSKGIENENKNLEP